MAIYPLFAGILDYPARPIANLVRDCAAELAPEYPEAHVHMAAFQDAVAESGIGQLQELYINAFDLRPDCTPNLGYHLFGDDGRRGLFLAELKGRMRACGVALGSELPDHVSLLLRYMHLAEPERCALIEDCMIPAVSRMAEVLDLTENPYKHAIRAMLSLLQQQHDASVAQADAMGA